MKLCGCHFSLRSILMLQLLVAATASWWIAWPGWTASKYAQALANRDALSIERFCPGRDILDEYGLKEESCGLKCTVAVKQRTYLDVLFGRGEYLINVLFEGQTYWGKPYRESFSVWVDKGDVYPQSRDGHTYSFPLANDFEALPANTAWAFDVMQTAAYLLR